MGKKFDFLSPGIEIREIDQSFIPSDRDAEGPIIIGRTRKGPALKPVKIKNLDDFVSVFGAPVPGGLGEQGDLWREGNTTSPTYASYAAQAWLASEESPVVMVRLVGDQHPQASTDAGKAGWKLSASLDSTAAANSTAYGLFLVNSASAGSGAQPHMGTGSLAAVIYCDKGYITLTGSNADGDANISKAGAYVKSSGPNREFTLNIYNAAGSLVETPVVNFSRNSSKFIRTVLNTNPQLVHETMVAAADRKTYWLGESFNREIEDRVTNTAAGTVMGILLPLQRQDLNWGYRKHAATEGKSGFVISQKSTGQVDLFRIKSMHVGNEIDRTHMIAIEDIREPTNSTIDAFGTFTICVKDMNGTTIERYTNLNLNPSSPNYIAKRIGDQYMSWNNVDRRYRTLGDFQNQSDLIYVEMNAAIAEGSGQGKLPVGFRGPVRPAGFTLLGGSSGAQTLGDAVNTGVQSTCTITYTTGPMSNGDALIIVHPDLGSKRINFVSSTGTHSTTFPASNTGSIFVGTADNADKTATAVAALLNSLEGYNATTTSSNVVTLTADVAGPHFTISLSEGPDAAGRQAISAITAGTDTDDATVFVKGNADMPGAAGDSDIFVTGPTFATASFVFPSIPLRAAGTDGNAPDPYRCYWGIRPKLSTTSTTNDPDYVDYLRGLPTGVDSHIPSSGYEYSFTFTLDDIILNATASTVTWSSGSWSADGSGTTTSWTSPQNAQPQMAGTMGGLLDKNVRQFLMPIWGGSDGLDVKEKEPMRNSLISDTLSETTDHRQFSINKAIDSVKDSEVVAANLLLAPGFTKTIITDKLISTAEGRKDVLAIIDLEGDYTPVYESTDSASSRLGSVATAVSNVKQRGLNSSYACCFYPWIQISDNINGGQNVWLPPSIAGLGAMASSQARTDVWFAPAGFNRGGLGTLGGPRGPSVIQARQRLDSGERDNLYEVNINPIATFPAEGVVIFGQKTLQAGQSALDRINVRRLLLHLKSKVGAVSRNLLFDQNIDSTWARFKSQVEPMLADVQARFGLTDYQLILDETTTTADLIDRNIMYAKIYVKPARAIEYIVVDFIITRTGADFV